MYFRKHGSPRSIWKQRWHRSLQQADQHILHCGHWRRRDFLQVCVYLSVIEVMFWMLSLCGGKQQLHYTCIARNCEILIICFYLFWYEQCFRSRASWHNSRRSCLNCRMPNHRPPVGGQQEWTARSQFDDRRWVAASAEQSAGHGQSDASRGTFVGAGQCDRLQWLCGFGASGLGQGNGGDYRRYTERGGVPADGGQ